MARTTGSDWAIPREAAIPRLLRLHGGRLLGLARRICGSAHEAEDLVQEVFVQAWRKWPQFGGRADPVVWLYTIARRACQRMHRKRAGEPRRLQSLDELAPFATAAVATVPDPGNPLDEQARRELRDAVGAAITTLPDDFRMALVLKDIVGFSVAEVGAILGVKAATVKTRVHRARLRVRQALEAGLPRQELPPPAYSRQVCIDLLRAKQDSLDRGVAMPNADAIICERCKAVFATLDLTQDLCAALAGDGTPPALHDRVMAELQRA